MAFKSKKRHLEITERNTGIISSERQKIIGDTRVAILGCGLGSKVAELAIRSGFKNILLVDGDLVSLSNLNRQTYTFKDIDRKKVLCLARQLRTINPDAKLTVVDRYLTAGDADWIVQNSDIIIDTIDLSSANVIVAVHNSARKRGVPVLFPINLGFSAVCYLFTSKSATLESLIGIEGLSDLGLANTDNDQLYAIWASFLKSLVPNSSMEIFDRFIDDVRANGWCPAPQLGLTANLNAALLIDMMIEIVGGGSVPVAPDNVRIDALDLLHPGLNEKLSYDPC